MKFKLGDTVRIISGIFEGKIGVINVVDEKDSSLPYLVVCSPTCRIWEKEDRLESVTPYKEKEIFMKTYIYGTTNIIALGKLKSNDCFQILEGEDEGCYGLFCISSEENNLKDDGCVFVVIFSEAYPAPVIKLVSRNLKVRKVKGEVSFCE